MSICISFLSLGINTPADGRHFDIPEFVRIARGQKMHRKSLDISHLHCKLNERVLQPKGKSLELKP